jgi:DNA modification methylase
MAGADSKIEMQPVDALKPYAGNARMHSKAQVAQITESIRRFGFTNPVLVSDEGEIIAGHGRVLAARRMGLKQVPTLRLAHLSADERRAYVIADNKLALNAGWDLEILSSELQALLDIDFEVSLTGFSVAEVDLVLDDNRNRNARDAELDEPTLLQPGPAVTQPGDIWMLGRHRLMCADARDAGAYRMLMAGARVDLVFTDPPYNVRIAGNVSGLGRVRHREFAVAAGEMSEAEFTAFLSETLGHAASACRDGAIAFICMDWRHMGELLAAGRQAFSEFKNLCVWNKTNAGMGTFYRSKHELVFVFKVGNGSHTNTFGLGDTGRYRTNVWDYAGVNSFGAERSAELAMHPTVKPVALVADAIRDCSRRGELVLDPFGGSGSTLIAAEICGRQARLIELDPLYCDTIIRRWMKASGKQACHSATGETFEDTSGRMRPIKELDTTQAIRNGVSRDPYGMPVG